MNWIALKALHELYTNGKVRKNSLLLSDKEIDFLIHSTKELIETNKEIISTESFKHLYEKLYLKNFLSYKEFLEANDLVKPQSRFEESDIQNLMKLKRLMDNGELADLRQQIIDYDESLRNISLMFFKNEKYLDNRGSLVGALKKILDVSEFANEKEQQYKYQLECHNPELIVLCENIDFLLKPARPRKYHIELWYAGGKNIQKLEYANRRGLPIFYSGDWDYDGLLIYSLVKEKIPEIQLLTPNGEPKGIKETEHNSHWKNSHEPLYGLDRVLFSEDQLKIINLLVEENKWIIEESNDLIQMVKASCDIKI